ncbi:hypothetical protein MFFC18_47050 [Mariniblastus fucicola]|uniref:Uncharacterized protein n=1 Tax=Mariniblastus fucicola TaxID=980251 RepID=A0A5B9PJC5_9BACT|nr:hypothetical protein MFFC18_47050 [Mariniblastus fucicola]
MQIMIDVSGNIRCVYDESIALSSLGRMKIRRGSHVEPIQRDRWVADLSPVGGPKLGPFRLRSAALAAERRWLEKNWLSSK